jgi:8-oxo-dGTP pyrophosphatase MutT (NUDIX family)
MSFLDHIDHCNNADLSAFLPLALGNTRVGWIHHKLGMELGRWPDAFAMNEHSVSMAPHADDFNKRSAVVEPALRAFADQGLITAWRDELYPVMKDWGETPLMQIERAACPALGIRSWGVHVNGYVRRSDGLHMWVAKRASDKTYPGMLDNMVAGGQPIGIGLHANVIKEAQEEAGIPTELSERAVAVGMISYVHYREAGLSPDQMFCYDLELPPDFIPENTDGEVEEFTLRPIAELAETVRNTHAFKFNCNLVIIDFLIRHGVLTPDNEPDYVTLCQKLTN